METGATALTRVRGIAVSARTFSRLAVVNAVALLVIVGSGATVRLTASGLGCDSWPGCSGPARFGAKSYHSYVEYSNRVIAFFTILITLLTWLAARKVALPRWAKLLALWTFVGTLAQAPLGAITVYYHLNPLLVLSHFLLSLVVLTCGVIVAVEGLALVHGHDVRHVPPWVLRVALVVAAACIMLVVTGTLATAAGPHPGSIAVRRLGSFQPAVWLHVRATAAFGISFAVVLVWLLRARSRHLKTALVLLGLLALQMAVGEIQYRTKLPWWLVLIHVTTAAAVWGWTVAFVATLWRPIRATRMG